MYELAYEPYDILIDYKSISLDYTNEDIKEFLDVLLENNYRFFMFCDGNKELYQYENINKNFLITNDFNIYDIDEYYKMYLLGDNEQYRSLFVSSDTEAIKVATSFGISCIFLVNNHDFRNIPDIKNFPDHYITLENLKGVLKREHQGVKLFLETKDLNTKYWCPILLEKGLKYYYDESITVDVYMLGRYFRSSDLRSYSHILTRLILAFKDERAGAYASLVPLLNDLIKYVCDEDEIDYITSVPCKPSKNDRFRPFFYQNGNLISNKVKLDLLSCTRNYDSQKEHSTKQAKANNVRGAFNVNDSIDVNGKSIIIIDDILTTGSTVLECAKVLCDRGAKRIILMPLGVTQDTYKSMPRIFKIESSSDIYQLRFNNSTGNVFWVAESGNYENYNTIKERYLSQNNMDNYILEE